MNKKFLSAILFGALMASSAGTFVSCKDYDDDITNLQEQIDQQKALSDKLAAVETSISSLQSAQTELGQQIANVQDAAEKAALSAQEAAIKVAKEDLEAAKAELKKAIEASASSTEESIKTATDAINAELAKVQGQVEALMALNDKVASLEAADAALAGSIADLDKKVADNAVAIGKMEAALAAQQTALEEFKTATGTDVAGIQAEIKKLQDALDNLSNTEDFSELAGDVKELQDKVASLSTEIQNINSELDLVWAAIAKGVTHVSLHAGGSIDNNSGNIIINGVPVFAAQADVPLLSARALSTWTFGENCTNPEPFVKGERTRLKATMVVRVSPVTASLNEEDIHFISTQLENGSPVDLVEKGLVTVTGVNPYEGEVLTRAGVSSTGLWTVEVEVNKDYDETDFDKATTVVKNEITDEVNNTGNQISTPSEKQVLFAVKVADSDNAARAAVSEYALAFTKQEAEAKDELDYFVWVDNKGYNVENLHNRFDYSEEDPTKEEAPMEYTWKNGVAATPVFEGALANTVEADNDNRQSKCLTNGVVSEPVVSSTQESFKIKLSDDMLESATHFYVELDKKRALSSDDSEIRTWNLYEPNIIGINQVYEVKSHGPEVTIGFNINDINDVIGFRVYAVNSNGTLVDPDGRAFYVRVGAVADVISAETTIIGDDNFKLAVDMIKNQSAKVDVAQAMKDRFAKEDADKSFNDIILKTDKVYKNDGNVYSDNAFWVYFEVEGQDELVRSDKFGSTVSYKLTDLAKIKSIVTTRNENINITDYVDDQVYNGTISITNKNGIAISTLNVSMKKVVPTTLPAGTNWNPAQLQSDGKTYKCYVLPNITATPWTVGAATEAKMVITDMFDIDDEISDPNSYAFYFTTNNPKVNRNVEGWSNNNYLTLTKADNEFKMIDDVTPYDAYVTYNYGKVSSKTPTLDIVIDNQDAGWKAIYCNIHGASYTFDWTDAKALNEGLKLNLAADSKGYKFNATLGEQAQKVVYGKDFTLQYAADKDAKQIKNLYLDTAIYGTSTYHAIYNGWLKGYQYGLEIVKNKCSFETSDNPGKPSRYFEIEWNNNRPTGLKALDFTSNPTGNVAAVLKITVEDNFGNERVIEMDMTIIPNI